MDLYEYQAKELFGAHGVPVLPGVVVSTAEEAREAAEALGTAVVVKAQVKTGGRGKAGGVKLARTPQEAYDVAHDILGQPGVTPAVDRTFPLEETADAMRVLVSSQVRGKLVIRVAA